MSIDRNSPLPLYHQLKRLLLAKIESGELKAGDVFPTEQQIEEAYEVSRTTVRQALSELEDEGRISRHRGRGTFVAKPKVSHNPEQYPNLADNMAAQGVKIGWILLSAAWMLPDGEVSRQLKLDESQKVFRIERIRTENDEAIGYHLAYVAPQFANAVDEHSFLEGGSLRYLRNLSVLEESLADRKIDALEASEKLADLLKVPVASALLRVQRLIYSPEKEPIEFLRAVYRGDRFEYHINHMKALSTINA
jgi:GntR family transcriptional regulator